MRKVIEQLVLGGFNERSALAKGELLGRCTQALGGSPPDIAFYVPGRVEVLGKHTDYAGGRSMTCATDRGFVIGIRLRSDDHVLVQALDMRQSAGFEFSPDLRVPAAGWENYVMTVARRVARNFPGPLRGANIAFCSDLPQASGMSSSSALVVGMFLAISAVNGLERRPEYTAEIRSLEDLGGYLGCCENGQSFGTLAGDKGVGTFGGSEDHTAILCSKPGQLSIYTYAPVRLEQRVEFPAELAMVIASSGVAAEKTAAAREKYNRISLLMRAIMDVLREAGWDKPTLAAAIKDDREAADCVRRILSESKHPQFRAAELITRFDQFVREHQRIIPSAADALVQRDWTQLGLLVGESQSLTENNLKNQIPQTVALVDLAKRGGAIAASAFGAGFGGSVWAFIGRDQAPEFVDHWRDLYQRQYPQDSQRSSFFITDCVGGAKRVI